MLAAVEKKAQLSLISRCLPVLPHWTGPVIGNLQKAFLPENEPPTYGIACTSPNGTLEPSPTNQTSTTACTLLFSERLSRNHATCCPACCPLSTRTVSQEESVVADVRHPGRAASQLRRKRASACVLARYKDRTSVTIRAPAARLFVLRSSFSVGLWSLRSRRASRHRVVDIALNITQLAPMQDGDLVELAVAGSACMRPQAAQPRARTPATATRGAPARSANCGRTRHASGALSEPLLHHAATSVGRVIKH